MVTVAHVVAKMVREQPYLEDAMDKDIISHAKLADHIQPKVEKELGRKVKHGAVVMALTRFSEKVRETGFRKSALRRLNEVETIIRSDIIEMTISKSPSSFDAIRRLYSVVDFESGDILNVIQGNHEITVVTSRRYLKRFEHELRKERVIKKIRNLSSLSIKFPPELVETPGFFSLVARELSWNGINIVEMVSTLTELTLVIKDEQITKAYGVLQEAFRRE